MKLLNDASATIKLVQNQKGEEEKQAEGSLEKFNCQTTEDFVYIMAYLAECKVYKREVHEEIASENGEPITITEDIRKLIQLQR